MESNSVEEYKKEFLDEIHNLDIKLSELRSLNVPEDALAGEVYLRQHFGDEIVKDLEINPEVSGLKTVEKLNEEDLVFDSEVRNVCETIADPDFDSNATSILARAREEEDE